MARVKTIVSRGTVERYADAVTLLKAPGDYVFVVRGVPRSIIMKCPDDCGEVLTINLDQRAGPAWRTYRRSGLLTVYPSVWRESGCRAHFIIWRDHLLWCDWYETAESTDEKLLESLKLILPPVGKEHAHYEDFALQLDAVPWDVLWACRKLERAGIAVSSERGSKFGARGPRPAPTSIDIKV